MNHDNYVIFKGSKDGLTILLSEEPDFETLKISFEKKVKDASPFFQGAKVNLVFQGRTLLQEEEQVLIEILSKNSQLDISFIHDSEHSVFLATPKQQEIESNSRWDEERTAFYKGTIRSGQNMEFPGSVVIIGDVNPGGQVIAQGNIIILGALKGMVHAGSKGHHNAFVAALSMEPMQLRIGHVISRPPDEKNNKNLPTPGPEFAYVHQNRIFIEIMDGKMSHIFFEKIK